MPKPWYSDSPFLPRLKGRGLLARCDESSVVRFPIRKAAKEEGYLPEKKEHRISAPPSEM